MPYISVIKIVDRFLIRGLSDSTKLFMSVITLLSNITEINFRSITQYLELSIPTFSRFFIGLSNKYQYSNRIYNVLNVR